LERLETDICVIGAGSGGLSVAAGAVQMGARVVLIEAGEMGGDCLNAGCVPSKALIAAAKAAEAQRRGFRGVAPVEPKVDFGAVKDHVAAVIAQIAPVDSQERFEGLGCIVIRAFARFTGPREVEAGGRIIRARRFVIATGSRPFVPPIQGADAVPYLTNETIFALRDRPEHLIVIGGGPIGIEMAQAHRRLGSQVTVIEAAKVLGREDPELAAVVIQKLQQEGIQLIEGQPVVRLAGKPESVEVTLGDGRQISGTHLLMAVGRKLVLDGMNLEAAGVAYSPKGVTVDDRLRSTNRRIFAVGDAAGGLQFTHVAGWHAGVVIRQAVLGLPARASPHAIPRATYSDPELAHVGLTEAEARAKHGAAVTVIRAEFAHNDRAQTEGATHGLIKVMVVKGRPVGASIVGPQAGELVGLWALALSARLKLSAIAGMVAPYPTLGEVSKRVAGAYFSPKLFQNPALKTMVRLVQRWLP
jgi:pyruvate/2-oxoglutarate dehydrogenase complex dihydrolipoamide dehydrogenase (E3) component